MTGPALPCGRTWNAGVRRAAIAGLLILGLIVLGYYAVYATTRHDVEWLISTTLFRLFMHVAPLAVFLLFLLVRAPEERWGDADVSGKSSGGARHRGAT